jgi:DNA invertase Pin-like site-specific DNA recombinase
MKAALCSRLHVSYASTARRGWEVAGEYVDAGRSGAKSSRPRLDRLMQDARRRRFDAVLTWKLDRWGRSLAHLVQSVQDCFTSRVRNPQPTLL